MGIQIIVLEILVKNLLGQGIGMQVCGLLDQVQLVQNGLFCINPANAQAWSNSLRKAAQKNRVLGTQSCEQRMLLSFKAELAIGIVFNQYYLSRVSRLASNIVISVHQAKNYYSTQKKRPFRVDTLKGLGFNQRSNQGKGHFHLMVVVFVVALVMATNLAQNIFKSPRDVMVF